jgi:hypothetical protein
MALYFPFCPLSRKENNHSVLCVLGAFAVKILVKI